MAEPRRKTADLSPVAISQDVSAQSANGVLPLAGPVKAPRRKPAAAVAPIDGAPPKPRARRAPKAAVAAKARMPKASVSDIAAAEIDGPALDGAAAREVTRIRDGMARIRDLLDHAPLPQDDAAPRREGPTRLSATATIPSAIDVMPPPLRLDDSKPVAWMATAQAPAPIAPSMALVVRSGPARAPSRMGRLVSAWGDWLTWKLSPPRIPSPSDKRVPESKKAAPDTARKPIDDAASRAEVPDPRPPVAAMPVPDPIQIDQVVAQAVAQIMSDARMRAHLQDMIHEELEGEMGARFSANLGALVRRQVGDMLDDRLTHL